MYHIAVMLAEKRFGCGTDAKTLGQRVLTADRDPCALGRKASHVILFALKKRFRDEHGHIDILMTELFELGVHNALYVLPNGVAVGTYDHASLYAGIIGKLRLFNDIGIPLRKINIHRCDLLYHFFVLVCHVEV